MINTDKLEKLGFKKAVERINTKKELHRKMTIAYEHYRFAKEEKIVAFNKKLQEETKREDKDAYYYKELCFKKLDEYEECPPDEVLTKIEEAINRKCFDTFEIAKIRDRVVTKDPIVFGRINGCPDRFFISQWDDDVRIEDILKENEG